MLVRILIQQNPEPLFKQLEQTTNQSPSWGPREIDQPIISKIERQPANQTPDYQVLAL